MIGTIILVMLLGVLLSALSAIALWRQMVGDDFSIGKIIFLVWMPGAVGGLLVVISSILLVANVIKGM